MITLSLSPSFNINGSSKEKEKDKPTIPQIAAPVQGKPTFDPGLVLMIAVVLAVIILSSAVLVYAARH
jgi:hypothetical protein